MRHLPYFSRATIAITSTSALQVGLCWRKLTIVAKAPADARNMTEITAPIAADRRACYISNVTA
jgi:hypothetical protein